MLRYMKYAYAVWQEGSFTAAAKKLYISQPALSLTIRKLEQEVGFPVFERAGKTVKLTPPGEKYIKAVEQILQIKANLEKELDDMLTLQKGQITVGCSTVISGCVLPRVLKCFMERYPGVRVELKVESSQVLGQLLESGGVDIVIDNTQGQRPEFVYSPLFTEQILLCVPDTLAVNHGLEDARLSREAISSKSFSGVRRVPVSCFAGEDFILLKPGNKMRYIADAMFREREMHPNVIFEFDRVDTAVGYTENGFGICFATDVAVNRCENTCFYLPDTQFSQREVYAIYKKNKYLTHAAAEFIRIFAEVINCGV